MKTIHVFRKFLIEQWRNYWIWILTISLAPFFVLVYNLISNSYTTTLHVMVFNQDKGAISGGKEYYFGREMLSLIEAEKDSLAKNMLFFNIENSREKATRKLKNKEANLLFVIPRNFSQLILDYKDNSGERIPLEFEGDMTKMEYILSAIFTHEMVSKFVFDKCSLNNPITLKETSIGSTGQRSEFELAVPGLMVFAIIMLMFSASIAIVNESEKGTLIRIRLAPIHSTELLAGISLVQVVLGIISAFITLAVAAIMGFHMQGSFCLILLISVLASASIIAFSLILASFSKSANQILIVGNFPFFIFMFFSGAMFPLNVGNWFTIGSYSFGINSILSPVHAVSALNKVILMQMGLRDILPEIFSLILLTVIYFAIGAWAFEHRHLRRR